MASPNQSPTSARDFVDALLSEQRQWTAVDQFSNWHEQSGPGSKRESYRELIPLEQPRRGEQYAFEVDLDRCSGCKACVAACHSLNGLEEAETWRKVGLLVGAAGVQQHVTSACHHCVDPGCLNGCPVLAYDKDPSTGIVRHLDDQCIGCQYCVMKCPYEVPQYSKRLGIVRKCDMCYQRLAVGEAPACVQACPTEAIRIILAENGKIRDQFKSNCVSHGSTTPFTPDFLPDSPDPALTLPTTKFRSNKPQLGKLIAADHDALRLEPAHWPLVVMLVLTQASAGLALVASVLSLKRDVLQCSLYCSLALLIAGIAAATLHLGQPLKAWRGFLGWRRSWLSRELLALHLFGGTLLLTLLWPSLSPVRHLLVDLSAVMGLIAVFTSVMVYVDTGRPAWKTRLTSTGFLGTALLLGLSGTAGILELLHQPSSSLLIGITLILGMALFVWRELETEIALANKRSSYHLNARIRRELLRAVNRGDALSFVSLTVFSLLALAQAGGAKTLWVLLSVVAVLTGELIRRYQFFVGSAAKRMPGGPLA